MASDTDCQRCPELMFRLSGLGLQVQAIGRRIEAELHEPTMSRAKLLMMVHQQLEAVGEAARGA